MDAKQRRASLYMNKYMSAQYVSEISPKISEITVKATLTFFNGASGKVTQERVKLLRGQDKMFVYFDCLNNDCTGMGFDLTSILRQMIRNHQTSLQGTLKCEGKEDSKYERSVGNTCDSNLTYDIFIIWK